MPNTQLERLTAEATELVRRAVEIGIQMERARVRSLLSADAGFPHTPLSLRTDQHRAQRIRGPSSRGPIAMVRKTILEMTMSVNGADAFEIRAYHNRTNPESPLSDKQVRGALKQLVNTGEAVRASRGRYLPQAVVSPSGEEVPDAPASGTFALAAE
jgi:hypothetical protein